MGGSTALAAAALLLALAGAALATAETPKLQPVATIDIPGFTPSGPMSATSVLGNPVLAVAGRAADGSPALSLLLLNGPRLRSSLLVELPGEALQLVACESRGTAIVAALVDNGESYQLVTARVAIDLLRRTLRLVDVHVEAIPYTGWLQALSCVGGPAPIIAVTVQSRVLLYDPPGRMLRHVNTFGFVAEVWGRPILFSYGPYGLTKLVAYSVGDGALERLAESRYYMPRLEPPVSRFKACGVNGLVYVYQDSPDPTEGRRHNLFLIAYDPGLREVSVAVAQQGLPSDTRDIACTPWGILAATGGGLFLADPQLPVAASTVPWLQRLTSTPLQAVETLTLRRGSVLVAAVEEQGQGNVLRLYVLKGDMYRPVLLRSVELGDYIVALEASPTGNMIAAGTWYNDGRLYIFDRSGRLLRSIAMGRNWAVTSICWLNDRYLVYGTLYRPASTLGWINVLDLWTGRVVASSPAVTGGVGTSVATLACRVLRGGSPPTALIYFGGSGGYWQPNVVGVALLAGGNLKVLYTKSFGGNWGWGVEGLIWTVGGLLVGVDDRVFHFEASVDGFAVLQRSRVCNVGLYQADINDGVLLGDKVVYVVEGGDWGRPSTTCFAGLQVGTLDRLWTRIVIGGTRATWRGGAAAASGDFVLLAPVGGVALIADVDDGSPVAVFNGGYHPLDVVWIGDVVVVASGRVLHFYRVDGGSSGFWRGFTR